MKDNSGLPTVCDYFIKRNSLSMPMSFFKLQIYDIH